MKKISHTLCLTLTLATTACLPEFSPSNPFDPRTSPAEQAPARIFGNVLVETDVPLTDVQILAAGVGEIARAGADGRFSFEARPGALELSILAPLHQELTLGTLMLDIGEHRELGRIELLAHRGQLTGRVSLEGGADETGTMVSLSRLERTVFTDRSGTFLFESVPVGRHDLLVVHEGYAPASVSEVAVTQSRTTTLSLSLVKLMPDADFAINSGARYTRTPTITLELYGFALPHIQVAEDMGFEDAGPWQAFAGGAHSHTLSMGDGLKHVYVRFCRDPEDVTTYTPELTSSIILDQTAPTFAALVADDGSGYTHDAAGNVTLSLVAYDLTSGVADMRIASDAPIEGAEWVPFAPVTSAPVKDPTIDGVKTITVQLRDLAGNLAAPVTATLILDTTRPALASDALRINGGSPETRSQIVNLSFGATGAAFVKVGDESGLAGRPFQPYPSNGSMAYALPAGDGPKRIYAVFQDLAGNETPEYSASIHLDTLAPAIGNLTLGDGSGYTSSATISLALRVSEPGLAVFLQGDLVESGVYPVDALPPELTLAGTSGLQLVTGVLMDSAGNVSMPFVGSIVIDPVPPALGTVVFASDSELVSSADVPVRILDTTADTMRFWEVDPSSACGAPACDDSFSPFSSQLTFRLSPGDGTKSVCFRFCDLARNGSEVGRTELTLDTRPPQFHGAAVAIAGGLTITRSPVISLVLGAADADGVLVGEAAGLADQTYVPFPESGALSWTLSSGDGEKTIYVRYRDEAGNESPEYSVTITLDTTAPAPGTLSLAGGSALTSSRQVALSVETVEPSATVVLAGDILEIGAWAPGTLPASVTLTPGDGEKLVSAFLVDTAGNPSNPFSDFVALDTTAPRAGTLVLAGGAPVVRQTQLSASFSDAAADTMWIYEAAGATCAEPACGSGGFLPFSSPVSVSLSPDQGEKTVCWRLCDLAGNGSPVGSATVVLDTLPPTLVGPALVIDGGAAVTRSALVQLALGASGASEVAIGQQAGLASSAYIPMPASGVASWVLSGPDGLKEIFVKYRDAAGNETEEYSASISLDTTAPIQGSITLAHGAGQTANPSVALTITTSETEGSILLGGDLVERGPVALGAIPATITLDGADGQKLITAIVTDAAGNYSVPFSALIELDTAAPAPGTVVLAGGSSVVNVQTIAVNISDTAADRMLLFEAGAGGCSDPGCGAGGFVPFAPSTSFTLSAGEGEKTVCWKLCDLAGNGAPVGGDNVTLSTYVPRPTPVLLAIAPDSHVAFSEPSDRYTVELIGLGLAEDTRAIVGDFILDCLSTGSEACQADADGGCAPGGLCEATCAASCTVELPPEIMRNSDTYVVRLTTPPPVSGGVETSEDAQLFSVIAPLPSLAYINPRGITQRVSADGSPVEQDITISLRASNLMDNVSFKLDRNYGRVVSSVPVDHQTRDIEVIVSTRGLLPSDLESVPFAAVNPGPGGGEDGEAFGINPESVECADTGRCTSNLRRTRTALASGHGVGQAYRFQPRSTIGAQRWSGGSAAAIRRASGALAARLPAAAAGEMLPFVPGALGAPSDADQDAARYPTVTLEDSRGAQPVTVLDRGGSMTELLLGRGDGSFPSPPSPYATGNGPYAVTFGDLDNDGRPEILVANEQSNDVAIRATGATGSTFIPMSREPRSVVTADMNGDGNLDLLTGGTDGASLRLGAGDLTFGSIIDISLVDRPLNIAVGDVDRDGTPDLVGTGIDGWVGIRLGLGDGQFGARTLHQAFGAPSDLALGDLDGDGILDIAVANWSSTIVSIFFGDGAGGVSGSRVDVEMEPGTVRLALGDVNVDGALDLVTANDRSPEGATLRLGNGDGTFQPMSHVSLGHPTGVTLVDLSGDGYLDLVGSGLDGAAAFPAVLVRLGNGDGTFRPVTELPTEDGAIAVAAGDWDSDGAIDLVTANFSTDTMNVYSGNGSRGIGSREELKGSSPTNIATHTPVLAVDLDHDGISDLVNTRGGDVLVWNADGMGGYGAAVAYPTGIILNGLASGDLDGDGNADVVAASSGNDALAVWLGDGWGGLAAGGTFPAGTYPISVALGDLDGDGILDAVTANFGTDDVSIFFGLGDGTFSAAVGAAVGDMPEWVALGDADHDGDLDLFTADLGSNAVSVLLNSGAGVFAPGSSAACPVPRSLAVGDLDADGALDVACAGGYADQELITIHYGAGDGTFEDVLTADMGTAELHVAITDVNGDGALDLVSANQSSDKDVGVRLGQGGRAFGDLARYPTVADAAAILVEDINGDGALDVLATGQSTSDISIWLLPEPGSWTQELSDMPAMSVAAPPGTSELAVMQSAQLVDRLAVRVRLADESGHLDQLQVSLRTPRGELIALDDGQGWAGATVWQASYPTRAPIDDLGAAHGWQPEGAWVLVVDSAAPQNVQILDFTVVTHGAFQAPAPGALPEVPAALTFPGGGAVMRTSGTTRGHADRADLSCVTTQGIEAGPGEYWYELELSQPNVLTRADVIAAFDAALELRAGPCSTGGAPIACDDDGLVGSSPRISGVALGVGTYCLVVDGTYSDAGSPGVPSDDVIAGGAFELILELALPL